MTPRHLALGTCAALVTAWSAWILAHPADSPEVVAAAASTRPAPRPAAAQSTQAQTPAQPVPTGTSARTATPLLEPQGNAFARRDWAPPPPPPAPPPPPPPPAPAPPPAPPAPPPLPTLPYKVVGVLEQGPATRPQVFLALNDKLLVAGVGETLEGGFRLDAILPNELVFTHVQRNLQLRLPLQGASS